MKKNLLIALFAMLSITACKKEEKTEASPENMPSESTPEVIEPETIPDSAAVANAWGAYMTPSKAHEMLANDTGKWTSDLTFWDPLNPEPQKATSTVEYKMILGGRYQEGVYSGEMWGMPFEGRGLMAYDNATEEFIGTWIDNMGTGIMITKGKYDENSKTLTMLGNMVDPVSKKEKKIKEIITYIDEVTQKMEMFEIKADGSEFKTMEINSKKM